MAFEDTRTDPGHEDEGKTRKRGKSDAAGRKDNGQEAVPQPDELMKSMGRLKSLYNAKQVSSDAFGKAVKATAKKSGFMADVVRAMVKAHAGEKEDLELATRRAEQLSLGFEALGKAE